MAKGDPEAVGADAPAGGYVQLLTPDGERAEQVTGPDGTEYAVDFTDAEYRELYRDLVTVRRLDAEATALQRQGELGIWASLLGQEAAQVGAGRAMRPQDMAFPTYREHGVLYTRGIDPIMPFGLFRGVNQGGWDPTEYKFNQYTIVIGAQTLHATGYAMGIRFDGAIATGDPASDQAVIVYYGDGASSEGDVHEAMVFAASYQTPQVFFLQNNQWAISVPVARQSRTPLVDRAAGYGIPSVQIDGNDVLAAYATTRIALDEARSGFGPRFIEAMTYRMGAHTSSDDPTKYRENDEVADWGARDAIVRYERHLRLRGVGEDFFADVAAEAEDAAADLRARIHDLAVPEPESMLAHVYTEPHPVIQEQLARLTAYESSFGDAATEGEQA
jgi:2-oxoisovalerate dehydrogenase E1 component alpha subunit